MFVSDTFNIFLCVNNKCVHHFLQNNEEMGWIDLLLTEIWGGGNFQSKLGLKYSYKCVKFGNLCLSTEVY